MRTSNITLACYAMVTVFLWAQPGMSQTRTGQVEVDFSRSVGTIRHLNDLEGGTLVHRGGVDLSPYFRELGVKYVRLHDTPWDFAEALDINFVFRNFDADPDDSRNYDFAYTDIFLKPLQALGVEIIFRLGYSMEQPLLRIHNAPPKDFEKWAHVCLNIVKHYNGGWDQGFHDQIRYWEIWNEPNASAFWTGTPEEYYKLYELTARAIKNYDPSLKVGGPALAGADRVHPLEFLEGFLKSCHAHDVPLDFVSWHRYTDGDPYNVLERSQKVRELMTQYGFGKAESILDEWNYFPGQFHMGKDARYDEEIGKLAKGSAGAAYDAAVLTYLEDSTVDIATFYTGTTMSYLGMFSEYGVPQKPFYAFKAFSELLGTPQRVFTAGSDREGFAVIAGISPDKSEATVLISNFSRGPRPYSLDLKNLPWSGKFTCNIYLLDASHDLERVKTEELSGTAVKLSEEDFTPPSVWLFRLKQGAGS